MKSFKLLSIATLAAIISACTSSTYAGLTVIPYGTVTDKIDLDIRTGIVNKSNHGNCYDITLMINDEVLLTQNSRVESGKSVLAKKSLNLEGRSGKNMLTMKVVDKFGHVYSDTTNINIIPSPIRSDKQIDGAWCGIYHWSEQEGLHWNKDIKTLSDEGWKELVRSMHKIRMDAIVIQEVFRNQEYVSRHEMTLDTYGGKAFYPSDLYPARMDIAANDPIEAILSEADKLDMNVLVGVGMWAWFDFSEESLEWHKRVAKELWEKYGHHKSFYAFYVSEESDGSLVNQYATEDEKKEIREQTIRFFKEFKTFCGTIAPDKPIMLATNSMNIPSGAEYYPRLLENLDILCPFGFARMPEGDLSGKEAADILQTMCNNAGAHLWFDLEAFLFNPDMSLYPKPIEQIIAELNLLDNFEKTLCYQYPGVFTDPDSSHPLGEKRTFHLFKEYENYLTSTDNNN